MKFGFRTPSLKRRVSARISPKRIIRHSFGLKAPKGFGIFTNPKKAIYNKVYRKTTFGMGDFRRKTGTDIDMLGGVFVFLILVSIVFGVVINFALALVVFVLGGVCLTLVLVDGKSEKTDQELINEIIPSFIEDFAEASPEIIRKLEREIKKVYGNIPEMEIVSAFHVSKGVSKIKRISTLASRWQTANCDEHGQGLANARARKISHFDDAFKYLVKIYLKRLHELITIEANKANRTACQRKTIKAKINAWQRLNDFLDNIVRSFSNTGYTLPGLEHSIAKTRIFIDEQKQSLLNS